MCRKSFIFGASTLARVLYSYLREEGAAPEAFVLDDAYCNDGQFCGVPILPYSQLSERLPPKEYAAYVAVGYTNMNSVREDVCQRLLSSGYDLPNYLHSSVMNYSAEMGVGNLLFPGIILDTGTHIGNGNIFYPGVMIAHDVKIGDYNFFAPRAALAGEIIVGSRNFFGLNCSVKNGVKISDSCFLGASAYAAHDLTSGSVLVVPHSILLEKGSEEIIKKVM